MAEIKCSICGMVYKSKRGERVSACPVCETKNAVPLQEETQPQVADSQLQGAQSTYIPVQKAKKVRKKLSPVKKVAMISAPILCLIIAFVVALNLGIFTNNESTTGAPTEQSLTQTQQELTEEEKQSQYQAAVQLMNEGKTAEAAIAFGKMGDYKDAEEKSYALWRKVVPTETLSIYGRSHTIGLKEDGTLVTSCDCCDVADWADEEIISVSAGSGHYVGLRSDGTVIATGDNDDGECDVKDWKGIVSVSAGDDCTVGLKKDGTVVATGYQHEQYNVDDWTDIVSVQTSYYRTKGVKVDGTIVETGAIDDIDWKDISSIDIGTYHTVGVKNDGTVVAYSPSGQANAYGHSNVSAWTDIVAVSVSEYHTVGLQEGGTVVAVGWNADGQCNVLEWTDIVSISAGKECTIGLKSDGTVVSTMASDVSGWTNIKLPS